MSEAWQLSLQMESAHLLLAARRRDRDTVFAALQTLAANPYQDYDFIEISPNQREYRVKVVGKFVITYWLDQFVNEVRVVRIERQRTR